MGALVADFQHQHALAGQVRGCVSEQVADKVHAVAATGKRQRRLSPVLGRQRGHALGVDVGRVAHDQVKRRALLQRGRAQAVAAEQGDARLQAMPLDIDVRHGQRVVRDVGGADFHLRVGQRGNHRQAGVASAQVQHLQGHVG